MAWWQGGNEATQEQENRHQLRNRESGLKVWTNLYLLNNNVLIDSFIILLLCVCYTAIYKKTMPFTLARSPTGQQCNTTTCRLVIKTGHTHTSLKAMALACSRRARKGWCHHHHMLVKICRGTCNTCSTKQKSSTRQGTHGRKKAYTWCMQAVSVNKLSICCSRLKTEVLRHENTRHFHREYKCSQPTSCKNYPAKLSSRVVGGVRAAALATRHGGITVPGDPATVEDVEDEPDVASAI